MKRKVSKKSVIDLVVNKESIEYKSTLLALKEGKLVSTKGLSDAEVAKLITG